MRLHHSASLLRRPSGFGLVELMVAMVIGLALTLVVSTMVARQEGIRRNITSTNDVGSNSAYASYSLNRELLNAGSGISQSFKNNYGCPLGVSKATNKLLPRGSDFPEPFQSVARTIVVAPVIAHAGAGANGSDVIAVMSGNSALSENSRLISPGSITNTTVQLANSIGLNEGDIVLISQSGLRCVVQQVAAGYVGGGSPVVSFGGTYQDEEAGGTPLSAFSKGSAYLSVLGNVVGRPPRMQLLGLNSNGTLMSLDLLELKTSTPQPLVDGIVDLRVRYGIDEHAGHTLVEKWKSPSEPGYTAADLAQQTSTAQSALRNIIAIRIGMILRSDLVEKEALTSSELTLFDDLGDSLKYTYHAPATADRQRYRAVEFTVPLRNARFSR